MSCVHDRGFMCRVHYLMAVKVDIRKSDDDIFSPFLSFFPQVDPNSHF